MIRHGEEFLWEYAAQELGDDERRVVDEHLQDCPECREELATIQVAQEALESARAAWPVMQWQPVDDAVGDLVERRLAATARRPWLWRLALGAVAVAVAAGAFFVWRLEMPSPMPAPVVEVAPPMPPPGPTIRVDRAEGLTRLGVEQGPMEDGAELRGGDVLRTSLAGKAFVHLPDDSHLRVAGGTQVALTRAEEDDVALTLERGRVAVRASHAPRRGFVVHTGGLSVHVIGTVFSVANTSEAMEVAVSEGKVQVDLPNGDALQVSAGQRIRLDARSEKPQRLRLTPGLERELSELAEVADAATAVEKQAVVAAVGGTPSAPPLLTAKGTPRTLPRLSPDEARRRQVVVPEAVAPVEAAPAERPVQVTRLEPQTEVVVEGPGDAWPSMAGGVTRGVPEARPASEPSEWATMPEPTPPEWASMPAASPTPAAPVAPAPAPVAKLGEQREVSPAPASTGGRPQAKDLETLFLERAQAAVEKGAECERYLLGLEDIAADLERNTHTELARVLRARCFAAELRPRQALNEYRKYLTQYPGGHFTSEAHAALGE